MRIALFDYKAIAANPAGGCHLKLLRALAREHEFTVFAVEFENPDPAAVRWVRVPVPTRPLALLFVCYHLLAPLLYLWDRLRTGRRYDLVQSVESNLSLGALVYAHFSHTTYLRRHRVKGRGMRGALRSLDHFLHACVEPLRYRRARLVVTPSAGLAEELERDLGVAAGKLRVIANPVAVARMERPRTFPRDAERRALGFAEQELVLLFSALGQFERKGLPQLLEALAQADLAGVKLLVVGGESDLVEAYRRRARGLGVGERVFFAGMQQDVRPFFWCADALILPSAYETFSLVTYEAAAAGLPLLAPPLNGVRDLLRDGENGFLLQPSVASITETLRRFAALPAAERQAMGERARSAAAEFSEERFADGWRHLYAHWDRARTGPQENWRSLMPSVRP